MARPIHMKTKASDLHSNGTEASGVGRSRFAGGEEEIKSLWRGLRESCAGRGRAYLISGEPGSGKSRLVQKFAAQAKAAQIRVVSWPSARDGRDGGESLAKAIMHAVGADHSGVRGSVDDKSLLESVHEVVGFGWRPGVFSFENRVSSADRSKSIRAFCMALEQAARSSPVILIVDGLHEADDLSVEMLAAAARFIRTMRLMIVATWHGSEDTERFAPLGLVAFAAAAVHLKIAPLSQQRSRELMGQVDGKRCDLLIAVGEAQLRKGEYKAAEKALRDAAELAEHLDDAARLTRIALALPSWHWPAPGRPNPVALLLAQRMLVVERQNTCQRAMLMARIAAELCYLPSEQRYSRELAADAMGLVAAEKNSRAELYVRVLRDPMLRRPEEAFDRFTNAEEILRLAVQVDDHTAYFVGGFAKCCSLSILGDMTGVDEVGGVILETARMSPVSLARGISVAHRASRAVAAGRFADAVEEFGICRDLATKYHSQRSDWSALIAIYAYCLVEVIRPRKSQTPGQ